MVDQPLFLRTLSEFAATLVSRYEISEVLYGLSDRVRAVLGIAGAGVTLADDKGVLRFAAASSEDISTMERVQENGQEGPCMEAFTTGSTVTIGDLADAPTGWTAFKAQAARVQIAAVAGLPMHLDGQILGALDLYDGTTRTWTDDEIATAQVLAAMATSYLVNASELAQAQRTAEQLRQALESRAIIEQAKGVVATQRQIPIDDAFELMRRHARSHQAPLRNVADAIVNLGLRL